MAAVCGFLRRFRGKVPAQDPTGSIRERLRLVSPELVKDLYDTAKAQLQQETARATRLDSKATTLLTSAGLSIAVASPLTTALLSKFGHTIPAYLLWMLFATATLGLLALLSALWALFVQDDWGTLNEDSVFNGEFLERADAPAGCDDLKELKDRQAYGLGIYRQYMIPHIWWVYLRNTAKLDAKAARVQCGQVCFVVFVVALLACEGLLFTVLFTHAREAAAAAKSGAAEGPARNAAGQFRAAEESAAAPTAGRAEALAHQTESQVMPEKPPPPPPPLPPRDVRIEVPKSPGPGDLPPTPPGKPKGGS